MRLQSKLHKRLAVNGKQPKHTRDVKESTGIENHTIHVKSKTSHTKKVLKKQTSNSTSMFMFHDCGLCRLPPQCSFGRLVDRLLRGHP
jgi:hypothetical protein